MVMNKTQVVKLRKEKGWTQETLAERAHVTVRTIQRLEAGQEVSEETLKAVSSALSVTVNELFDYVDASEREETLMVQSKNQTTRPSTDHSDDKKRKERQLITNFWEFAARFWWLIFPIGWFIGWVLPSLIHALR